MTPQYYINMGRWAGSIIGPFDSVDIAQRYVDSLDWRGAEPTIVVIDPPDSDKLAELTNINVQLTLPQYNALIEIVGRDKENTLRHRVYDRLVKQTPTPW